MCFIATTAPAEASDDVRQMYLRQQARYGYVPNYARPFCHRPEVMALWAALLAGIRRPMDRRRFELATFAAAQALGSSYCSLAHGGALREWLTDAAICALAEGDVQVLSPADAAVFRLAQKVAREASAVTAEDIEALRREGLSDAEIFDVAAAAAARCFLANLCEGLGALPDADFRTLEPRLQRALTVGRPVAASPSERVPEPSADAVGAAVAGSG